jgi:membrane protein DedA with SNARE-associated domain
MELLHDNLIQIFFSLSPFLRNIFIFVMAFGEGLPIIGSFLPGGTIAILIGSLSVEGFINPWIAIHILAIGSLCGDLVGFTFGRYLLHIKWVHKIVYHEKHVKKWDLFDRHAALVIIFGKIIPVIRSMPALFAGVRKMNISKYIIYVLIGSYIWAIAGIFGGKYLAQLFGDSIVIFIVGILILTGVYALYANRKK